MTPGMRTVQSGLVLLPAGFLAGLAMSLYAFVPMAPVPAGLARYDDLPRRLLRLAHVAAIMLPLVNVVLGPWIDRVVLSPAARARAASLLRFGAAGLPLALAIEALVPPASALHLAAPPAVAFSLGVLFIGVGAWRAGRVQEWSHEHERGRQVVRAPIPGDAVGARAPDAAPGGPRRGFARPDRMNRLAPFALLAVVAGQLGCATAAPSPPLAAPPPAEEVLGSLGVVGVVAGSVATDATVAARTPAGEAARRGAWNAARETFVGFTLTCLQPTEYFLFQLVACPVAGVAAATLGAGVGAVVEATRAGPSETVEAAPGIVAACLHDTDPAAELRDRVAGLANESTRRRAWRFVPLANADAATGHAPPIDSLLEVSVDPARLDGPETQVNPPLVLAVTVRVRLLRVSDTTVLHEATLTRHSTPRGLHVWLAHDAGPVREEIGLALRELGERVVDEVLLLHPRAERRELMAPAFVAARIAFLRDGVTTRGEIVTRLGDPVREYDAGRVFAYVLHEDHGGRLRPTLVPNGAGLPRYRLVVTFTPGDRLESHSLIAVRER